MDCQTVDRGSALREALKWLAIALLCAAEWGLFYLSVLQS